MVEQNAVAKESEESEEARRFPEALIQAFVRKGVVTAEEIRVQVR